MWSEINNDNDLNHFLETQYAFHDSCIKELKYISGAYVDEDLSMHAINSDRILKIIIQRQFKDSSTIELEFIGLKYLKMFPKDENYTCEILNVTMILKEDCIIWCDSGDLTEADIEDYTGTVICASKVRWRIMNEYIGAEEVYKSI